LKDHSKKANTKCIKLEKDAALHRACCKSNVSVEEIDTILRMDPLAASRAMVVRSVKTYYNPILVKAEQRCVKEIYSYPLNIAIKNRVHRSVLDMLIEAAPSILSLKDGSAMETSPAILLKNAGLVATLDKMMLANSMCATSCDRHMNTLLHVACTHGASLEIVRHLCIMYPEAMQMRNRHFKTPLELSQQRIASAADAVSTFLLERELEA
jgi:hypothetical protein